VKVYVSSTLQDLLEHREAVALALRRMGHDVLGMEQYTAEDIRPLERCLTDVRASDAYVLLLAWRYGFLPPEAAKRRPRPSITELEYEEAVRRDVTVLAFMLDPQAPWPPSAMDAFGATGPKAINAFRRRVGEERLAGVFTTPDNLASQVAAAIATKGLSEPMAQRALDQGGVTARMRPFAEGAPEALDSAIGSIIETIREARDDPAVPLELAAPGWWSTRLYLMAALTEQLSDVRQLVFTNRGRFVGMASPRTVRQALCADNSALAAFHAAMTEHETTTRSPSPPDASDDVERETRRWIERWRMDIASKERSMKLDVRRSLLVRWLGESFITRCIEAGSELTVIDVQQIIDSPLVDVPIERPRQIPTATPEPADTSSTEILVVSRDAFAVQLARQWVRAGLPRIPVA
jgi:hypothetical protein